MTPLLSDSSVGGMTNDKRRGGWGLGGGRRGSDG